MGRSKPPATEHDAYRKDGVQMAYGLAEDGKLRHIREVDGGLGCRCICPACDCVLIARQGNAVKWHFSHQSNQECTGGPETALHLLAKEVLEEHRRVLLPAVVAEVGAHRKVERPSGPSSTTDRDPEIGSEKPRPMLGTLA